MNKNIKPETVTKLDIAESVASKLSIDKFKVIEIVSETLKEMRSSLLIGKRIELRGFGSFQSSKIKRTFGRNPKNPSVLIPIPETYKVRFKPGASLKNVKKNA